MKSKPIMTEATQMCAVDYAFKRIGGKYKARILWYLNMKNVLRYGELSRTLPDITIKMLTQTLRELEDDKLIIRKMYYEVPPKVEYRLSETGLELIPFIRHLHNWGKEQIAKENSIKPNEQALLVCQAECGTD
ncbi:helix-turn-helix transcriptional regulator [Mucilaginibacter pallidiroseus]|uniref:Helix-turn-helix transcriptional regulator n=1 Tax=Mucilaginibacter pallidiroseus TaxID=2599295 RepID=A0A563UF37_9SPHI|nr:helix-turn-helix domain-containing protein [Mucilaginibacter pallidiroseus]TWR29968.1 helix-turn-helix transcriptional regulator [Mucilaginibacter pallidiroseus]